MNRSVRHFIHLLCGAVIAACMMTSCQPKEEQHWVVGVSQSSNDVWRQKMNKELVRELTYHPELTLRFRQADENSQLQALQVDSFIAEGVDALIVTPNKPEELREAVARAYNAGIPVVVSDRYIEGDKWTAYVGGNNHQVGLLMSKWLKDVADDANRPIRVIELLGLPGTTAAVGRHEGLMKGLGSNTQIQIAATACGEWKRTQSYNVCKHLLSTHPNIDAIVAQNDLMAMGAADAADSLGLKIRILGVDGLTGEDGGIEALLRGQIETTAAFPCHGDIVLQRVAQILKGEAFRRETHLRSELLYLEDAQQIALDHERHESQVVELSALRDRISDLTEEYNLQRTMIALLVAVVLLTMIITLVYIFQKRTRSRH